MEFFTVGRTAPSTIARQAREFERDGWDGLLVADSQNVVGDAFVQLALVCAATSTLQLGTGVTNPYTRHAAVTAAAAAGLQAASGGRVVLGIGRGDSSLAHIGLAPSTPERFAAFLDDVQAYLRGEAVRFADAGPGRVDLLPGAGHPEDSRLMWLDPALPKVPVDVAATGPKVIAVGARVAERLTFALGADVDRLTWAIRTARAAREEAGLDPADLSFGAYLNIVAHPDLEIACDLAANGVSMFSRFSVLHGRPLDTVPDGRAAQLARLAQSYDLREHGNADAAHRKVLDSSYIADFAIVGPPERCVERLRELEQIGLDRVVILTSMTQEGDSLELSRRLLVDEVLSAFPSPARPVAADPERSR